MKSITKKILSICCCISMMRAFGVETITELSTHQQRDYDDLSQYWFDKEGNFRFGAKDATAQFSLTSEMMDRMTVDQLKSNMNIAIQRFKEEERKKYLDLVTPILNDLKQVKDQIQAGRAKVEAAATTLATALKKSKDDIMKIADENLKNLVSRLPDAEKVKIYNSDVLAIMKQRSLYGFKVSSPTAIEMPDLGGGASAGGAAKKSGSGAGAAAAGVAAAAVSSFDIGGIVKFAGEVGKYGRCKDIHFDIVRDSKGIHVTTKAE